MSGSFVLIGGGLRKSASTGFASAQIRGCRKTIR